MAAGSCNRMAALLHLLLLCISLFTAEADTSGSSNSTQVCNKDEHLQLLWLQNRLLPLQQRCPNHKCSCWVLVNLPHCAV